MWCFYVVCFHFGREFHVLEQQNDFFRVGRKIIFHIDQWLYLLFPKVTVVSVAVCHLGVKSQAFL